MRCVSGCVSAAVADFLSGLADKEFAPRRAELLRHAHGRVLEIGAGTGFNARHYPSAVDELVLTEPGGALLARAQHRAAAAGRHVEAIEAPAEALPFEDRSFDAVVSTLVLCSVRNQDAALAEVRRVLRTDGSFLFIEHVRADEPRRARWQDRLERPWSVVAMGCHPNRPTLERIEAAGFVLDELRHGELPKSLPIIRPLITGRAHVDDGSAERDEC
ncbi:MAG: class I SAM-dependent methyltransferase [Actinobacteria bacterium]|nr:MAG: class I SAM-dependent methyltransferase [Actinomycetota bacterium]